MKKRVAVVDNLKSMRFSSASLEALVTCDSISGKRMFVGEGSRPNSLTWIMTLNGVSFATDFAQRSVIIKLKRPAYSGSWQDAVEEFIDQHRDEIIADCIGFLQAPPGYELTRYTRWANWERDVLSRLPDPAEAQRVIAERQGEADAEGEETVAFEDYVRDKLIEATYSPDSERIFIPSKIAAALLSEVMAERYGIGKASRIIRQRIREGGLPNITENDCKTYGRGFIWVGPKCTPETPISRDLEVRSENRKSF
jgi:hypothetical protein